MGYDAGMLNSQSSPVDALTSTARRAVASRITIARRRANVSYLPTFAAQNRAEMMRPSTTAEHCHPMPRPTECIVCGGSGIRCCEFGRDH